VATYYVATTGSDVIGSGSIGSPWRTIAYGVGNAVAGDTLYIRGGTYTGSGATIDSQGHTVNSGVSYGNAVTISGYPGETAIIYPDYNVSAVRLTTAVSYIIIQDLTMDMAGSTYPASAEAVILSTCDHIRIQRCDIKNGPMFGIHSGFVTPFIELLNNKVHNFGYPGDVAGDGHGLYLTGSDGLYEGNDVYDNHGYGFHIYNNTGTHADPSRIICRSNRIHGNGTHAASEYGIVVSWGDDFLISNNLVYDNDAGGILVYTSATNAKVYNNTIYGNSDGVVMQYYGGAPLITNNIIYVNGTAILDNGGGTGTPVLTTNLTTNPSFTNAGAGDFTLLSVSAAINAGTTLASVPTDYVATARPHGASYDIGAYEFVDTGYAMTADAGSYAITGAAATLIVTPVPATVPAKTQARSGIERAGAARTGYYTPNAIIVVGASTLTTSVIMESLHISLELNNTPSTASFTLKPGTALPALFSTVVIAMGSTSAFDLYTFAGSIVNLRYRRTTASADPFIDVDCLDYRRWLNRQLITHAWVGEPISNIVTYIIGVYTSGFNANGVEVSTVILDRFQADHETAGQLFDRLVQLNGGGGWLVRYPVVYFFGKDGEGSATALVPVPPPTAPMLLTPSLKTLLSFTHSAEGRELRNRVTVEGRSARTLKGVPSTAGGVVYPIPIDYAQFFTSSRNGEARIGKATFTYFAKNGVSGVSNRPYAITTAAAAVGATSLTIDDSAALVAEAMTLGTAPYYYAVLTDYANPDNVFFVRLNSTASTVVDSIPATGYGSITSPIPTGTWLFMVDALWTVSALDETYDVGTEVAVLTTVDDVASQAAIAALETVGDGVYSEFIQQSHETNYLEDEALAAARLAVFAPVTGLQGIQWRTRDMNAKPGAMQAIAMTGLDAVSDTLMITRVGLSWPVKNAPPFRDCEASDLKLQDVIDVLSEGA